MNDNFSASDFGSVFSENNLDSVTAGFTNQNICGEGASCIVYRMRLRGLLVAVKRLRDEYQTDPAYVASYRKEFQIGQRLKHDALPVYRDFNDNVNNVYIVMDYVDGISLEEFIKTTEGAKYFSSVENVRRFLKELLNVVGYLHRCGVIHCDLKPANIMLRHIDRGVMLLDLDKSYCDVLDTTHGGTATISDPLAIGQKPTAFKDYSAIGKIIYAIEENVPGFPSSKFKRFRKASVDEATTFNILKESLEQHSYKKVWMTVGIVAIMVGVFISGWYIKSTYQNHISAQISPDDEIETLIEESTSVVDQGLKTSDDSIPRQDASESQPSSGSKSIFLKPSSNIYTGPTIDIDIDTQMADFIVKVKEAQKTVTAGISRNELSKLLHELIQNYLVGYKCIVENTKAVHPEMQSIDVELAVARAYENSRACRVYTKFNQVVADTLRSWDGESYYDFQ